MKTIPEEEQKVEKWKITPRVVLNSITNFDEIDLKFYNGGYYFYNKEHERWDNEGINFIKRKSQQIVDKFKFTKDGECTGDITNQLVKEIFGFVERRYYVEEREIDRNLIGVKNGILNTKTKELMPANSELFLPIQIDAIYDPSINKNKSKVKLFLEDIIRNPLTNEVDQEEYYTIEEMLGYPLEYGYPIKKAGLILGETDSGKTTLNKLFRSIYREYNVSSISLYDLGDRFKPIKMVGKLTNYHPDLGFALLDDRTIGNFMSYTGNEDSITVEEKGLPAMEYKPSAKLIFNSNFTPKFNLHNDPFLGRWNIIICANKFSTDGNFIDTITTEEERSCTLNMMLEGLERLRKNKAYTLKRDIDEIRTIFGACVLHKDICDDHNLESEIKKINKLEIVSKVKFSEEDIHKYKIFCPKCKKLKEMDMTKTKLHENLNNPHKDDNENDCDGELFYREMDGIKSAADSIFRKYKK